jgi:CHAD domain-containing protein/adenylate cyclase class IV
MREVEQKYRVSAGFTLPELAADRVASVDGPTLRELTSVYYDSPDLRLARAGITLRHRSGDGGGAWQLKLPVLAAGPDERDELEIVGELADGPPAELVRLVRAYLRSAELAPVATLRTRRLAYSLRDEEGVELAELVDDEVEAVDGGHATTRFRELEVEDRAGGREVLEAVGAQLHQAGAVQGRFEPKLVRALGRRATAEPDPPPPGEPRPEDPAGDAVTAYLRRQVRALMAQDPRVRRDLPDAVHQMRVAARRLRSGLRTFGPLLDQDRTDELRSELKWLGGELGAARDLEVIRETIEAALDDVEDDLVPEAVRRNVMAALDAELAGAQEHARAALEEDRYVALLERLVAAAGNPPLTPAADRPAAEVLPELVRKPWTKLARRGKRLAREGGAPEDYHAARIAAKRARYAAEAVAPVMGKDAARFARKVEKVQDLLGHHHDAIVAADYLRRSSDRPDLARGAFSLGVLYAREQAAAERLERSFADLWPRVSAGKYRWWMTG